jgi:DNA-binding NtrC family response regulator
MDLPVSPTILVVEDDPAIARLTGDTLGDEGYRVLTARTAAEARSLLITGRCGLVLSDAVGAVSPADAAFWVGLEAIRDAAGTTPVVIFSAHRPEFFASYAERGFAGLLPKPFDIEQLVATVRRFAGTPAG